MLPIQGGVLNAPPRSLPPAVLEALRRGQLIEAIKLLRASGIGLKEAKDAIEASMKGQPGPAPPVFSAGGMSQPLPAAVVDALQRGEKIEAIRLMREQAGLGLQQAKDAVEAYQRTRTPDLGGLSPGQVSDTGSSVWWVVAVLLICLVGYLVMRRLA